MHTLGADAHVTARNFAQWSRLQQLRWLAISILSQVNIAERVSELEAMTEKISRRADLKLVAQNHFSDCNSMLKPLKIALRSALLIA